VSQAITVANILRNKNQLMIYNDEPEAGSGLGTTSRDAFDVAFLKKTKAAKRAGVGPESPPARLP
jgi:hypothetical protein